MAQGKRWSRVNPRWRSRLAAMVGAAAATAVLANSTAYVTWINPQAYTDGSVMAPDDIKQTTIRCSAVVIDGQRQACSISPRIVPGGTSSTAIDFTFSNARGGQVCFQAQTEAVNGAVSDWSAEACKTVAGKKPMPPVLTVR